MRFGPQFTNLPVSVPSELYSAVKIKDVKPKIMESPNVDQRQLIQSIVRMLPERIWFDPMVFPQKESVLMALAQLSETGSFVGGWLDSTYSCVPSDDDKLTLFNKDGDELVTGHSGELFHYAKQFCRKAIPAIVITHRLGFVKHPKITGMLADDLSLFRKVRESSVGLDRISKIEELDYIDQDKTINKFVIGGLQQNKVAYHLGAGDNMSSSQRALLLVYDTVILVDPRCKEGLNSKSARWQDVLPEIPPDADIISDVAYGDDEGMTLEGFKELVDTLYKHVGGRLVMVKIPLQYGYNARGVLHCKPRPHNLEVVVVLDEDGDPLDALYDEWYDDVIRTNKQRNEQLLCMAFNTTIKDVYNTSTDLYKLAVMKPPILPPPRKAIRSPKKSRNQVLGMADAGKGMAAQRHVAWYKLLKNKEFDWNGPTVQLPPTVHLSRGSMGQYDPGLPDVALSLRSLRLACIRAGYEVVYHVNSWIIQ